MFSHHHERDNEDESAAESSILDLDHAPPPPTDWRTASLPEPPQQRLSWGPRWSSMAGRSSLSLMIPGLSSRSLNTGSSQHQQQQPQQQQRHRTSSMDMRNPRMQTRSRSFSTSSVPAILPSNHRNRVADMDLPFVSSYPPRTRAMTTSLGGTDIPFHSDLNELKEEEESSSEKFREIVLSGTEIDEVLSGETPGDQPQDRWNSDESAETNSEEDTEEEDEEEPSSRRRQPIVICGKTLPLCFSKRISWSRVATFVVNKAPCFCFMPLKKSTYRAILARLIILSSFVALAQIAMTIWFVVIMAAPNFVDRTISILTPSEIEEENSESRAVELMTTIWNLNGSVFFLGALAFIVVLMFACSVRAVRSVNLKGSVRLLWVIIWVLPLFIFFVVTMIDPFYVTSVWIKFWWRYKSMAWFRHKFCNPREYANTLCAVPVFANATDEQAWCIGNFNSTSCVQIRNDAEKQTESFLSAFYYGNVACSALLVFLLFLVQKILESIISRPFVQKSKEANIPRWLLLPTIVCGSAGLLYAFSSSSVLNPDSGTSDVVAPLIGPLFIGTAVSFLLAAILAWFLGSFSIYNTQQKHRKSIAILVFIVIATGLFLVLTVLFSASVAYSLAIGREIIVKNEQRGSIACFLDKVGSCTNCEAANSSNGCSECCPEWSVSDVNKVLQAQAKTSATIAAIGLLYASGCLRYGFTLKRVIMNYQIDYV